ncbi:type 1 glutamine amidotransferase domain-containing protein [Wenyingzhuangia sp. IMCC45533]
MKKVLFVLTSHDTLGDTGEKTGFWIEEFASPYYLLKDNGIAITIASPKGGQPPIDPKSATEEFETEATVRFNKDKETQEILAQTLKLEEVDHRDYDAIFFPGGHGPLWDLANNQHAIKLIENFYSHQKYVSAVCHAPAVFKYPKNYEGIPLIKGKMASGFTNGEEEGVGLTDVVPFLVEDMLKENGANYQKGKDWEPFAVEDGLIITGQNPASSELVAKKLLAKL